MKNVALVFGREALFGVFSPISSLTEVNLQKAISLLENDACDFAYIALDHFDREKKELAEKYLDNYVKKLEAKFQARIFISASSRPYMEMFTEYVKQIPEEVCVDILSRMDEKTYIEHAINASIYGQSTNGKKTMPLVFIR